jgi:serine protease Do
MSDSPIRRSTFAAALLVTTALAAGTGAFLATNTQSVQAAPITVTPVNPAPGFSQLVTKVKPAVVQISVVSGPGKQDADADSDDEDAGPSDQQLQNLPPEIQRFMRQFGGNGRLQMQRPQQRVQRGQGSGFIIDGAGYIVTNNHVVDNARTVDVTLTDGSKYTAKVIGTDAKTDLALVKIDAGKELPYVAFGDSDNAHEGDWVIAVGNPYGLGGTVTAGIISAHGRDIHSGPYDDFLQIDAPINPGNSGGPLFNQSGQVVGVDAAIYSPNGGSVGIGFAIPSNVAKMVVAQLREHGTVQRGWLGVSMQPLTPSLAKAAGLKTEKGVIVNSIVENSPAAKAGVQQGDVITQFGGKAIEDTRDLAMAVANTKSGATAKMTVIRNGATMPLNVTIAEEQKPVQAARAEAPAAKPAALKHPVGMSLAAGEKGGVVVGAITPGSHADDSGLQVGDIIERVNGTKVSSPDQVIAALRTAEDQKREAVSLLITRDGHSAFLGLQLV